MAESSLTFGALREANKRRLPVFKGNHGQPAHSQPDGSDWSDAQWCEAVLGELGEYANVHKHFVRGDMSREEFQRKASEELADVACYLDILAYRLNIDLGAAVLSKFNKVSARIGCEIFLIEDGTNPEDQLSMQIASPERQVVTGHHPLDTGVSKTACLLLVIAAFLAGIVSSYLSLPK